MNKILIT